MILLELTEKEAEAVKSALITERYSWEDKSPKEAGETIKENRISQCNSLWAKLDLASQPQEDILITSKDLFQIISLANGEYRNLRADLHISNKTVEEKDFKHISLANAVIMWLNSKNLLKKLARFDYTDQSFQYEVTEE